MKNNDQNVFTCTVSKNLCHWYLPFPVLKNDQSIIERLYNKRET